MDPLRNIPRLSELSGHLLCLPTTDRGTFTTLTSVLDIQAWTTAKADEYRRFALALLAIHNLAAPIHRLPTEVLERIFSNCWQDWNSLRLPHVCRLWRSILLRRPEFWADAVAKHELKEKREIVRSQLPLIDSLFSRATQYSHSIEPKFYIFPPAIAQAMSPYVGRVTSLQVAAGRIDLQGGLWPALRAGIPNLETLTIWLAITEEDLNEYERMVNADFMQDYHASAWTKLPVLSGDALPKLSRLTCPHGMVGRFGDVPLRHLKAQVQAMGRSQHRSVNCYWPAVVLGRPEGLHLEPYCSRLETLEIMPTSIARGSNSKSGASEPLECFSLQHLRIEGGDSDKLARRILSWLLLPQATFVHITGFCFLDDDFGTKLHSIIGNVDRACLQQHHSSYPSHGSVEYRMQCFAGSMERLCIDGLHAVPEFLISVFGESVPVTHLVLSEMERYTSIDLQAFPHVVHLDVSGSDIMCVGAMLQPTLDPRMRQRLELEWGSECGPNGAPLSPKLAELVISCPPPSFERMSYLQLDADFATNVDKIFNKQFDILQQALAKRASYGTRLTHLTLFLRPATPDSTSGVVSDKAGVKELEAGGGQQEHEGPEEEAGCRTSTSSPDHDPESNETVEHKGPVKSCAFWPSDIARRSALQSLRELVDGPVILKLLDDAGDEISVEEA